MWVGIRYTVSHHDLVKPWARGLSTVKVDPEVSDNWRLFADITPLSWKASPSLKRDLVVHLGISSKYPIWWNLIGYHDSYPNLWLARKGRVATEAIPPELQKGKRKSFQRGSEIVSDKRWDGYLSGKNDRIFISFTIFLHLFYCVIERSLDFSLVTPLSFC